MPFRLTLTGFIFLVGYAFIIGCDDDTGSALNIGCDDDAGSAFTAGNAQQGFRFDQ